MPTTGTNRVKFVLIMIALAVIASVSITYVLSSRGNDRVPLYIMAAAQNPSDTKFIKVDVLIDGKPIYHNTPGDKIPYIYLKPGRHTLQCTASGYEPYEEIIEIKPTDSEAYNHCSLKSKQYPVGRGGVTH